MGTLTLSVGGSHVCSWDTCRDGRDHKKHSLWKPPTYIGFAAPVPKPPDYSTQAKITARCWEAAGGRPDFLTADKSFAKALKAFRQVAAPIPCPAEDWHEPKWEYRFYEDQRPAYQLTAEERRECGHWQRRRLGVTGAKWTRLDGEEENQT